MSEAADIDKIDDIMDMVRTMTVMGVSSKGLRTLDEMKEKVKETLKMSQKKSSWTAKEAFSVLTDAKQDDERKRAALHKFYEDTEDCLHIMEDKVQSVLEHNIGNLKDKMASNKRNLKQKEYIVLVAGETSSGKSTLLNLILGEQLLPSSMLSTTSTICELKYGATPKLVAHFKDKELPEKTILLSQSMETSQQSYLQQISSFVHVKSDREKGSDYKKIELYWPHSLLKQGIVIVDSPGVGESDIMDDIVKTYLPEAFAFIYVINSANAGGIQRDRVEKLIDHVRKASLDQHREESSSTRALFVCNKWDQVPPGEVNEVKNYIIKKINQCWPNVDPYSQIIYMSSTNASSAQALGIITDEFDALMNGIKSMVLKSIEARLQTHWRWLDYLLSRMAYHTKAFIRNSSKDRAKVIERMMLITERLLVIQKQQSSVNKELQEYLECKTDNAVSALSKYLKSSDVAETFTSWTLDDVPNTEESWEVTKNYIQKALMKRLQDVIAAWEAESHVFADARKSLVQYFQERFNFVEGQLRGLEDSVIADDAAASPAGGPPVPDNFSVAERVIIGVTSPIWVPVGLVVLIVSVPLVGVMAVKEKLEDWNKTRQYEKDKGGFMAKASKEYLTEAAEGQHLRSYVVEQLKESHVCLKQVVARIPELIEADKLMCQQLRDENRSQKEIEELYRPLYERSVQLSKNMAMFGIKDVRTMDISCEDLEWNDDGSSLLGTGAFASVYRGKLKLQEGEQPVALKVWKEELNDSNAGSFHAETEMLRKLNYPFIVKFYGAALQKEGDQVRGILVMELCKENLMRYIFLNPNNIPGVSSSPTTAERNVIRWAKDIVNALDFIHKQGIVHRDLKLENILLSQEYVVKVADVGVSKEANMITGTMTGTPAYVAPEVIRSSIYDSKADIYSFGIMMWEMWYGKRALLEVGGNLNTFLDKVAEGKRPSHVEDKRKPPTAWQKLMEQCWDDNAEERPTAAMCHTELTSLYQEAVPPL